MRSNFDGVMEFGGPLLAVQSNGTGLREVQVWFNNPEQTTCRRLLSGEPRADHPQKPNCPIPTRSLTREMLVLRYCTA